MKTGIIACRLTGYIFLLFNLLQYPRRILLNIETETETIMLI